MYSELARKKSRRKQKRNLKEVVERSREARIYRKNNTLQRITSTIDTQRTQWKFLLSSCQLRYLEILLNDERTPKHFLFRSRVFIGPFGEGCYLMSLIGLFLRVHFDIYQNIIVLRRASKMGDTTAVCKLTERR